MLNRKQESYFTVAWPCPGTTGQEKKCFGPIRASGAPRRDKQEFSWCQTARIQSMILHTGSHGGGSLPLNCRKRKKHWHNFRSLLQTLPLNTTGKLAWSPPTFFSPLLSWKSSADNNCSNLLMEYTEILLYSYFPNYVSLSTSWHASILM